MSKRHQHNCHNHTIPDDIPFRENLVFYAPMTEQCCCDYVHNIEPFTDESYIYNGRTYTPYCRWNDAVQMWEVHTEGSGDNNCGLIAALNWYNVPLFTGLNGDNMIDKGATFYCELQQIAENGNGAAAWLVADSWHISLSLHHNDNNGSTASNTTPGTTNTPMVRARFSSSRLCATTLSKCVYISDPPNGRQYAYKNGIQTLNATQNVSAFVQHNPDTVSCFQIQTGIYSEKACIKDIRIYNRALTAQEIAQL